MSVASVVAVAMALLTELKIQLRTEPIKDLVNGKEMNKSTWQNFDRSPNFNAQFLGDLCSIFIDYKKIDSIKIA